MEGRKEGRKGGREGGASRKKGWGVKGGGGKCKKVGVVCMLLYIS
jgi:hypothetical protein